MKLTDLVRHLLSHGCVLVRDRGKHSVYCNAMRDRFTAVPRHREINTFTVQKYLPRFGHTRAAAEISRFKRG